MFFSKPFPVIFFGSDFSRPFPLFWLRISFTTSTHRWKMQRNTPRCPVRRSVSPRRVNYPVNVNFDHFSLQSVQHQHPVWLPSTHLLRATPRWRASSQRSRRTRVTRCWNKLILSSDEVNEDTSFLAAINCLSSLLNLITFNEHSLVTSGGSSGNSFLNSGQSKLLFLCLILCLVSILWLIVCNVC